MAKKRGEKKHFEHYKRSFLFTKPFWMTVIYDFAYCITIFSLFILLLWLFAFMLEPFVYALQHIGGLFSVISSPDQITPGVEMSLSEYFGVIQSFYIKAGILFFGGLFALFAVTTTYKSFIWSHLTKQKFTKKYFVQFFKVNVLWQFVWLLVACLVFFLFEVAFATYCLLALLFLYMYFTPFLRARLLPKHTLKQIYRETFVQGVKKIPQFIVPIVLIIITVTFALWIAAALFSFIESLSFVLFMATLIFVTLSWVRFYFSIVAREISL